jgi:hypothetical protein
MKKRAERERERGIKEDLLSIFIGETSVPDGDW